MSAMLSRRRSTRGEHIHARVRLLPPCVPTVAVALLWLRRGFPKLTTHRSTLLNGGMLGVCDRCRSPLDIAVAGAHSGGEASALLGDSYVLLPEKRRSALPDLSATLTDVQGAGVLAAASMHEQLRTVQRLLELSDLMHEKAPSTGCGVPLCDDCASGVLNELQRRLEEAHAERELLHTASADLLAGDDIDDDGGADASWEAGAPAKSDDAAAATKGKGSSREQALSAEAFARERAAQVEEEARLRGTLDAAVSEQAALADELRRLQEEWEGQRAAEEERHRLINRAAHERQEAAEEAMRAVQLVAVCEGEISRLRGVDVLSEVFAVDLEAPIPTINGLRLGRQSGVTVVEWSELNAALGQVVLLLHTLARFHLPGGTFVHHVLVPHGSLCSVYAKREPTRVFELYGSGRFGGAAASFFGAGSKLDKAQAMLLACVGELVGHASAHFSPRGRVPSQPPFALDSLGSLVGSASAAEAKKLLAVLAWLLQWSRHARTAAASGGGGGGGTATVGGGVELG